MAQYYYIGTLLPSLSLEQPPEMKFQTFDQLLRDNLSEHDYAKTQIVRNYYDLLNLRAFWLEEDLDPHGEMTSLELEEALTNRVGLPSYVYDFIDRYEKRAERIRHFPQLLAEFFQQASQESDPFLRRYLGFERELRLVWTAYRAKKLGKDLSVELQYENPDEDLIAQLLAQKDADTFEAPEKYQDLKILFETYDDEPLELQKALDEYRLKKIDELVDIADLFSIERILAYTVQLIIVEQWFELDKQKGMAIVNAIVKET